MTISSITFGDGDAEVRTNEYRISKSKCYLLTAVVLLAFAGLTLGLVFGLKSVYSMTDAQKYETCRDISCKDSSFLQELNDKCTSNRTTTRPTAVTTSTQVAPKLNYRLPTELVPYHYDVLTRVQFVNATISNSFPYYGEVTMHITCVKSTASLVFHISELQVDNSTLRITSTTDAAYGELTAFRWANDYERQFFVANLSKEFSSGHNYTLSFKYLGFLTDDNVGFYRSSYVDSTGNKKWLMTSKLEPTWARKSFPCFDEPSMKATWKIKAVHRKDYNALSNMPVETIIDMGNDLVQTEFETTPRMSSYLFALVVSDFVCIYQNANSGLTGSLPIGSCGRPNIENQLEFGLDVGVRIIEYLQRLYGVKYPLPKCDHIAIPDFASGAMENWGLITYRQAQYLLTPGFTPPSTEQAIATTIVHEVAHMWFGDIVSPLWWNDIWLNEGLARYFEYTSTAYIKQEYQLIDQFKNLFFNMLQTDAVANSRAISIDVSKPEEIRALFDTITYSKGGSIIEMVNNVLGNQTFYKGLNKYLERYSYVATDGEMFWNSLDEAAKEDSKLKNMNFNEIMNTWMKQMGYPVVTIKRIDARTISLSQNHFLLDPSSKPTVASDYNYRWFVPFTHTIERVGEVNSDTVGLSNENIWEKVTWLLPNKTESIVQFDQPLEDDEFVLANLRGSGFYRVNYDNHFWDRIVKQLLLNKDAIPVENRAQFIQDAFAFSEARIIDGEKPFELAEYLSSETRELPILALLNRASYFYNMLVSTSAYGNYQTFMSGLVRSFYNKLDWSEKPTDSWMEKQIRTTVVSFSCLRGVPECVDKARSTYAAWMAQENNNQIPSAYRAFVYCTAIREGGENEWNFASARYKKETDATERNNLLTGMSCTTRTWLVSRFLNDQLSNPRVAEGLAGLRAAAIRPDAILKTWNVVKENWSSLFTKYGTGIAGLLVDFSTTFNTQLLLDDFNSFFANNADQSALATQITTARNRIARNVEWYKKSFNAINEWFLKKYDQQQESEVVIMSEKSDQQYSELSNPATQEPNSKNIFDEQPLQSTTILY